MNKAALQSMIADLRQVGGVNTVKAGIERTISGDDYPLIRVVIDRLDATDDYYSDQASVSIFFGEPRHEFDDGGLLDIYGSQLEMHRQIRAIMEAAHTDYQAMWVSVTFDVDQLVEGFDEYKVAVAEFTVTVPCNRV